MKHELTKEKIQWLHDACEEAAAAGVKLTMNPNELLMFTSALLAAHEQEPVAVVEPSDYVTAAQISDEKPRKIAVRELYEGALVIGQSLYENPAPSMHLAAQKHASGDRPAVWVRLGDSNHAPDCTLDHDEAREWEARGLEVLRMVAPAPAPVPVVPEDYFASLVIAARLCAEKAMRKFPQPNYVLNKVAEESGEVIKAVIHYTEGREEWENVEGEIIDNLAMLIRLVTEGDQVIGFVPPESCRAVAPKGV
ncbi:TPA: hypothetical protein ACNV5L_003392 [Citrobacter braakii]